MYETHIELYIIFQYLGNIFAHGFLPVIAKPTRICNSSATLIDHIHVYTNNITSIGHSGIIITDVADNFGTYYLSHDKNKHNKHGMNQIRLISEVNIIIFKNCLDEIDFNEILQMQCPNEAYNSFLNFTILLSNIHFLLRTIGAKSKNIKREPCFTNGLLTSSKKRAKLLTKKISKPTELNIHNFKIYNNIYNKLIRYMKISYFYNAFDENKHDIKKTWSIMRQAIGKFNNKSSYPPSFMINETLVTDITQVAEGFNNYFSKLSRIDA